MRTAREDAASAAKDPSVMKTKHPRPGRPRKDGPLLNVKDPLQGLRMRKMRIHARMKRAQFVEYINKNGVRATLRTIASWEAGYGIKWETAVGLKRLFPWISLDYLYYGEVSSEEIRMVDTVQVEGNPYY